jgi:hypothetical protein
MSGDFILRHKVHRDFTVLPNRVLRDRRLRWSDRGLLAFLLHLPGNFKLNYVFLARESPDGVDAVSSCVRRLCSFRYVQIERERDASGRYTRVIWTVTDSPEPELDFPNVAEANAVRPGLANRPLTSTSVQQERSGTTTTAPTHAPTGVVGLDDGLLATHRDSILKSLNSCPEHLRQQVVDEAVGIATAGRIRSNVGALIRKLALAAAAGTFEPAAGVAVAMARLRTQQERERKAEEEAERRRQDTPEAREASRLARDAALSRLGIRPPPRSSSVVANQPARGGNR